jgi:radical SAM superfamily enzyme YgiQ (UPF0313 family)
MPLGVGYMKAVMDQRLPEVRSRVFAYPDRLISAMKADAPDVLMVSNYCWNEALSVAVARCAKRIRPDALVVMGGPNIPLEPERQVAFLASHPEVDVYVLGEGDFLASELVERFLDCGKSVRKLGEQQLPSCLYRRRRDDRAQCRAASAFSS